MRIHKPAVAQEIQPRTVGGYPGTPDKEQSDVGSRAELGFGFMQSFVRMQEQVYSNVIGQHVTAGSINIIPRLQDYAVVIDRSIGQAGANARATALLARAVATQANVLGYIDGIMIIGFAAIGVLLLMLLREWPGLPVRSDLRVPKHQ